MSRIQLNRREVSDTDNLSQINLNHPSQLANLHFTDFLLLIFLLFLFRIFLILFTIFRILNALNFASRQNRVKRSEPALNHKYNRRGSLLIYEIDVYQVEYMREWQAS